MTPQDFIAALNKLASVQDKQADLLVQLLKLTRQLSERVELLESHDQ